MERCTFHCIIITLELSILTQNNFAQKTIEQSTQWGVSLPNTFPMKKHLKSRNPALNIPRRHEAVATDTVFSPAVDSGVKQAQVFVGRDTLVSILPGICPQLRTRIFRFVLS